MYLIGFFTIEQRLPRIGHSPESCGLPRTIANAPVEKLISPGTINEGLKNKC